MICTFGDTTDVVWWRELQLPDARDRRLGRPLLADAPTLAGEVWSDAALDAYAELAGKTVKQAQQQHRRAAARVGRARSASRSRSRTR